MKHRVLVVGVVVLSGCRGAGPEPAPAAPVGAPEPVGAPATLVLTGGKVFTADAARPWAQAIAIRGEEVVAVGDAAEVARYPRTPDARVIELGGRVVIPGINDAHVHEPDVWVPRWQRTTNDEPTMADVVTAVRRGVVAHPPGTWLAVQIGTELYGDPTATRATLDAVAPHHPVWTSDHGGHARLVNTAALRALAIAEDAADPPHGAYGRDARTRRLDGWLYESANWRAARLLEASAGDAVILAAARQFEDRALRLGITSVQVMPSVPGEQLARALAPEGGRLRWRIIHWPHDGIAAPVPHEAVGQGGRVRRDGVKYVLDGTPLERNAWMTASYRDRPGHVGAASYSDAELRQILEVAARDGEQVLLHAVGDATIGRILATMEAIAPAARWRSVRVRIEHGDGMTPALAVRAAALGVVVVQNAVHFLMPAVIHARLGDCGGACQPLRSLVAAGVSVALGSDGPLNPYLGVMAASLHPTTPAEALTREQAIIAYTAGAAFAERAEATKGVLAPGQLADLAVLTQDVFTAAPDALPATEAWLTIVGGQIVYSAEGAPTSVR